MLDVGALMGSLVGQTESNIRQALRIADAMAPCILFDEIEKALSGVAGSGQSRLRRLGPAVWLVADLAQRPRDRRVLVGTCNDISKLPPEFARAERFDACSFSICRAPSSGRPSGRCT